MRIRVDRTRRLSEQPEVGHNRWHPDIPPIASVAPGQELTVETLDGLDGQITADSRREDLPDVDRVLAHPMTGPIAVEGAEPGDVLVIDILGYETVDFGWTAFWPGSGLLGDLFERPFLVRWRLADGFARSDDLPGVAIPDGAFAGVIGVAPSHELFERFVQREWELCDTGAVLRLPDARGAVPALAADGLRTIPPRETGGNLDIRGLRAGSRLMLPVHVPGALLSVGDLHFAQGDGEVCVSALETAGAVTLRVDVRKGPGYATVPTYEFDDRAYAGRSFATVGLPIAVDGSNGYMDVHLAARNALVAMLDYIENERGYTREQAYALASVAVDLRISEVVDVPNPVVSAVLPLGIFDDEPGEPA